MLTFAAMHNASAVESFLQQQMPEALELLRQMVGMNSFTLNRDGVSRLGRFTAGCFAPLGFQAEFVPARNAAFGDHLVLTRPGRGGRGLALVSHLDTVFPPEEEARNQFRWQPEGDRIFGPGTQDIKGGTVMIWLVLRALQAHEAGVFEDLTWRIFLNAAEEMFSPDFGEVCRARCDAGTLAALMFEAEGREGGPPLVVVARKGRAAWRVNVSGRGAHAGSKHPQGANAAVQLGLTVQRIAALTDYARGLTFNVGSLAGGTVANRVPHAAVAEGEFRAFTPDVFEQGKAALLALAGPGEVRSAADGFPCEVGVELLTVTRPWPRNPGSDRLAALWLESARELGRPLGIQQRGGLSDGNLLWDALPTLDGLGPWGDNDHCSERSADGSKLPEFVEVSSFVPKALLNVRAITKLAGQ